MMPKDEEKRLTAKSVFILCQTQQPSFSHSEKECRTARRLLKPAPSANWNYDVGHADHGRVVK